jgi:hypothetical protein
MKREGEPNWYEIYVKQEPNRDWNERFKSVEKDARITLSDEVRKRIIEACHSYHDDVGGGPHLSSKQVARAAASIERKFTRALIALQSCSGDVANLIYYDVIPASMLSPSDFREMTKSMDALVKRLRQSKRIAARGRRSDVRVDFLLVELRRCYEATGRHVAFRKNKEGRRVSGPYPDYLRAIRRHVFQGKVLHSDEAFIDRARKAKFFNRDEEGRRLRSKFRLLLKASDFWAGPARTEQMLEREIEAIEALPRLLSQLIRQQF